MDSSSKGSTEQRLDVKFDFPCGTTRCSPPSRIRLFDNVLTLQNNVDLLFHHSFNILINRLTTSCTGRTASELRSLLILNCRSKDGKIDSTYAYVRQHYMLRCVAYLSLWRKADRLYGSDVSPITTNGSTVAYGSTAADPKWKKQATSTDLCPRMHTYTYEVCRDK